MEWFLEDDPENSCCSFGKQPIHKHNFKVKSVLYCWQNLHIQKGIQPLGKMLKTYYYERNASYPVEGNLAVVLLGSSKFVTLRPKSCA